MKSIVLVLLISWMGYASAIDYSVLGRLAATVYTLFDKPSSIEVKQIQPEDPAQIKMKLEFLARDLQRCRDETLGMTEEIKLLRDELSNNTAVLSEHTVVLRDHTKESRINAEIQASATEKSNRERDDKAQLALESRLVTNKGMWWLNIFAMFLAMHFLLNSYPECTRTPWRIISTTMWGVIVPTVNVSLTFYKEAADDNLQIFQLLFNLGCLVYILQSHDRVKEPCKEPSKDPSKELAKEERRYSREELIQMKEIIHSPPVGVIADVIDGAISEPAIVQPMKKSEFKPVERNTSFDLYSAPPVVDETTVYAPPRRSTRLRMHS